MNAEMGIIPDGYFVAKPKTIGSSDEEMEAMSRGELAEVRVIEIRRRLHQEMVILNDLPIEGRG